LLAFIIVGARDYDPALDCHLICLIGIRFVEQLVVLPRLLGYWARGVILPQLYKVLRAS